MGKVIQFPGTETETETMHFDREKILHCIDFLSLCMSKGEHNVCKCMCSKECIDATVAFLTFVSDAWENANNVQE